jgi:hypothetical protein
MGERRNVESDTLINYFSSNFNPQFPPQKTSPEKGGVFCYRKLSQKSTQVLLIFNLAQNNLRLYPFN